jgi:hypothetical protein
MHATREGRWGGRAAAAIIPPRRHRINATTNPLMIFDKKFNID